ncbi:MAG TPA: hypothetical protein VMG98_14745 [Verrucomicrobiae bacterium]|nr:hypothetical protein [Verrucomicrobiae bacterium]
MSWDRRLHVLVCAAAIAALAACGGGASNLTPSAGSGTGSSEAAVPPPQGLEATAAPASRFNQIESQYHSDVVTSPSPSASPAPSVDPIANWQLLQPLYISANGTFSVPSWITQCTTLSPLEGFWYLAFSKESIALSQFDLSECTLPSPSPSQWFTKERPSIVALNAKVYVVEFDVGLFSIASTPIAQVAPSASGTFDMVPLQPTLTLQADHLYAFFLGDWLNTPPAVTESI